MDVLRPHFPSNDQETAWKALVSYGLEDQIKHIEQGMGKIGQVVGEMSKPGVDRSICVRMMREFAQIVMRDMEGLMAFSHVAETMIPSQPLDVSPSIPAPAAEAVEPDAPAVAVSPATPRSKGARPKTDPLQVWRDASDPEFISNLKGWMEEKEVSQDELCRVLEYKPVYVRRVMRGTDPLTVRFRERLLDYVASRGNGQVK